MITALLILVGSLCVFAGMRIRSHDLKALGEMDQEQSFREKTGIIFDLLSLFSGLKKSSTLDFALALIMIVTGAIFIFYGVFKIITNWI